MHTMEIHWPWICIKKTIPLWGSNRCEKLLLPSTTKLPQGGGSFSDLVMEVGIYIKLLWHSWSPPQFLAAGSHVVWKCGLGLSLIWKNFFVAYGLNIQWEMCEKTRNLCVMKFVKALHNMLWPFNVPIEHLPSVFVGGKAFHKTTADLFHIKGGKVCYSGINPYRFCFIALKSNPCMSSHMPLLTLLFNSNLLIAVIHWFSNLNPLVSPLGY